ncbi:MAG: helix-turn-helix transcriptional regulator [Bacteroidota bacterium]
MMRSNFLQLDVLSKKLAEMNIDREVINSRKLYKVAIVTKGQMHLNINDHTYEIKQKSLYFIAPGQVSKLISNSSDIDGYCLAFDVDYFLLCLKNQVQLCFYPFFQFDKHPLLLLNNAQNKNVLELILKIELEYNSRNEINDDLLTRLYLNILLIEIERIYKLKNDHHSSKKTRKKLITSKFIQLVEKNYMSVKKVTDYADMLAMAPNYLNDIVKETINQSASEIIHDRLILEAKAQLIQTEMSVTEVAYHLQFNDSSYFCRFFRKKTGVSPQVFRETNHF